MTRTNDYKVIAHILAYRSSYEDFLWIDLCPPPEFIFWSPSPQYLRMWPGLEIGLLHSSSFKMRSCWDRVNSGCNITSVLMEKEKFGHKHTEGEHHVKMNAEKGWHFYKSRNTKEPAKHHTPGERHRIDSSSQLSQGSKPTDTLTLDFQPPDLCETIKIPSLSQ